MLKKILKYSLYWLIMVVIFITVRIQCKEYDTIKINIKWSDFILEIADNDYKRRKGLMWREKIDDNKGMLFVFDEEKEQSFWMKNTLIPLDIIWLDKNNIIQDFVSAIPCKTKVCPSYLGFGDKVIELKEWSIQRIWITKGDFLQIWDFK